jgi:CRP/FNR family cyclic AMP-dependent transcriptional regulator
MNADHLKSMPLFAGLSRRDRDLVARYADEVDVPAGKTLTEEGGSAREFFVIDSGTASVTRGGQEINTLGPGDFFGEIGLLRHSPRTATVTATSPMRLVVLFAQNFAALEDQLDEVGKVVDRVMAERLASDQS